jgi:hypothetical protein
LDVHDRLSGQISGSGSQAAFRTGFRVTPARQATYTGEIDSLESIPGLLKSLKIRAQLSESRTSFLKRVTGRIFTISDFTEASRNFIFGFLYKKTAKNGENHQ